MELKTNTKGIVKSFSVNTQYQEQLLPNKLMSEKEWLQCISPLQYILIPIGIINLLPNQKNNLWKIIISYMYPISICLAFWYLYDPGANSYLHTSLTTEKYILYAVYSSSIINMFFVYWYIKWYYIGNQHHIFLLTHLYEYIVNSTNELNTSNVLSEYYKNIYSTCKYSVVLVYAFLIFLWTVWFFLGFFDTEFEQMSVPLMMFVDALYCYDIWWINTVGSVIFILNLRLLQLRYYAFTGILCKSDKYNKLLNLHSLQEIYQNDHNDLLLTEMNDNDNDNKNVDEISKQYLDLILLFQKNCDLWNLFLIIKSVWLTITIFHGFMVMWISNKSHNKSETYNAFAIWFCTMFLIVTYFIGMASLNKIPDDYTQLLTICYVWMNKNNGLVTADISYLLQLAQTNRCCFTIMNIELSMNMTIVLITSSLTPIIAYIAQWYFDSISFY